MTEKNSTPSARAVDNHNIALLATGNEITEGEILNTNSRDLAAKLFAEGISPSIQIVVPDNIFEIEQAIRYLLQTHRGLIITGGLGPTSDDITRLALSKALNRPLLFDEAAWADITQKLQRFGYQVPPECNRQQALFPKEATIIPNPFGTAAGCFIEEKNNEKLNSQWVFMLPGPPNECLPMLDHVVLPTLINAGFKQTKYYRRWTLFGVSEGKIAEELDALISSSRCKTGYRLHYPYTEFKLYSDHQSDFLIVCEKIEKTLKPYLIGDGNQIASELFDHTLSQLSCKLTLCDLATGGALEHAIKTPKTKQLLQFVKQPDEEPDVIISGLDEFWQITDSAHTSLHIQFSPLLNQPDITGKLPLRAPFIKRYAVEWICQKLTGLLPTLAISLPKITGACSKNSP